MPGVYISYPFCDQKCSFCNFASGVSDPATKTRYLQVLLQEMKAHKWKWQPQTLYLGGGTPSSLALSELRSVLEVIPNERRCETTLECTPESITAERASAWRDYGIDRVSLGVQSFVHSELRLTGRRHDAAIVSEKIALLRNFGLGNINVDLIAGLPGQTRESWSESLAWVERLRPPHVSVYVFEVDEDSRLGKEKLLAGVRYGATLLPSDDIVAEFYETAVSRLAASGIERYEISNFARPGFESRHNLKYWRREPYVGFGLDAHSFQDERRWGNPDDLKTYLDRGPGANEAEICDAAEERFFVGLRLSAGIEPDSAEWTRFAKPIAKWTEAGMLEQEGRQLRLSSRGVLLSNEILEDFIA